MSRIGVKPIPVPTAVTVKVVGQDVTVSGPKGSSTWQFPSTASVSFDEGSRRVQVTRKDDAKQSKANHGLTRALIANMVLGVFAGFEKRLQIFGTGYNCKLVGRVLHLNIGFSGRRRGLGSQFEVPVPEALEVVLEREAARGDNEPAQLLIKGYDKQQVGEFAAEIRALRKTDPYKGKGIRYEGEVIRRKQGKAMAGST